MDKRPNRQGMPWELDTPSRNKAEARLLEMMVKRQGFGDTLSPMTTKELQSVSDHFLSSRSR